MPGDPRRELAFEMYRANALITEIVETCRISRHKEKAWRMEVGLVRRRGGEPDRERIDAAVMAYRAGAVQENAAVARHKKSRTARRIEELRVKQAAEDEARVAKLRVSKGPVRSICPSDCVCLLCQLREPVSLYHSPSFVDAATISHPRQARSGCE